jgi:O-antigen/teichoic acid export membrane protein
MKGSTVDLKKKAVRSAGINFAAQIIGLISYIVGVIVLARLLTPRDYGLVAMVTAFSQWLMNFGMNGFPEYIIQKQNISNQEINSIFWSYLFIAIFLSISFMLFGLYLVHFYAEPELAKIAVVLSSGYILYAIPTIQYALLKREMKFNGIAAVGLISGIMSVILSIVAAIAGMGYWAVVTRQLTGALVASVAVWFLSPWRPNCPRYIKDALPSIKYAVKVYCNFSLDYVARNIDNVLLGKFCGSEILGVYDRAYHLSSMPAGQVLAPLNGVALSMLSRLRDDRIKYISCYIKVVSMVSFVGALVALIFTLTAQDLVVLLLGSKWNEVGKVAMAFGPGIAAMFVYGTHSWLHLSLGTPGRWLRWNIFASILSIAAFIIAAPYGAVAMGIAVSAIKYTLLLPGVWYAGRPVHLSLNELLTSIWAHFASAVSLYVLWQYISINWVSLTSLRMIEKIGPISRIIFTSCFAALFYLVLVTILERSTKSISEIISLCRIMFNRNKES